MSTNWYLRFLAGSSLAGLLFVISPSGWLSAPAAKEPKDRWNSAPPTAEQLAQADSEVRQLFRVRIARADSPVACREAAGYLLDQSPRFDDRPELDYALHSIAADLASRSEDLALIERTYSQWGSRYPVDSADRQARTLHRLARQWNAERWSELTAAAQGLAERELNQPTESPLDALESLLNFLTSRTRSEAAVQPLRELRTRVSGERLYRHALASAKQTLLDKPHDPQAHTVVGLHLCQRNQLWTLGLTHLVESDQPQLQEAAKRDLQQPQSFTEQVSLGDTWLELSRSDDSRRRLTYRAAYWCQLARAKADSLTTLQIDDRLDAIAQQLSCSVEQLVGNQTALVLSTKPSSPSPAPSNVTPLTASPEAGDQTPIMLPRAAAPGLAETEAASPGEPMAPTRSWQAHPMPIWTLTVSPDGQQLATAGEDRVIKV